MQIPEMQKEHHWLQRLVGEWAFETECSMGRDQPPSTSKGKESVRSLGGLWTIGEGESEMPGGGSCLSIMTLGFDPEKQLFVETFIAPVISERIGERHASACRYIATRIPCTGRIAMCQWANAQWHSP